MNENYERITIILVSVIVFMSLIYIAYCVIEEASCLHTKRLDNEHAIFNGDVYQVPSE